MQIDWISGTVATRPELSPKYTSGWNTVIDPEGEVTRRWPAFHTVVGSFDDKIQVKTPDSDSVYLSGNPCKLFQGHNAFGSTDFLGLFLETGVFIREKAGIFPGPETFKSCEFSKPRFSRLDLTRSYRFPTQAEALAWIRGVAASSRSRHGASLMNGDTVYFGKNSTRWTFKMYPKQQELFAHPPRSGSALDRIDELLDWCNGVVRFELTLRTPELENLSHNFDLLATWQHYFDRLTLNGNHAAMTTDLLEQTLKSRHRLALHAWRAGMDLRSMHSKSAFYLLRQQLLNLAGIDISSAPVPLDAPSVILDPAGWDPEPIHELKFEPRSDLTARYGLQDVQGTLFPRVAKIPAQPPSMTRQGRK